MIEHDVFARRLREATHDVTKRGEKTWQRVQDWTKAPHPDRLHNGPDQPAEGDGRSDQRIEDHRDDAAAARYHAEVDALTERIDADLHRLRRIIMITHPDKPDTLRSKELLSAQVVADGWCSSCWRDEQHLNPITLRRTGEPYYAGLCKRCGEWRAEHGQLPPVDVLRIRRNGGRVRQKAS